MGAYREPLVAALLLCAAAATAGASVSLGVNLVGSDTTALGPAETAGLVPQAFWNNAAGTSGTLAALADSSGAVTSAGASWFGRPANTAIADAPGDGRLMRGYVSNFTDRAASVTVWGLQAALPGCHYDVLVYFDGRNAAADWAIRFDLDGDVRTETDAAGATFAGTFVEDAGGNVLRFAGCLAPGFTLTAWPAAGTAETAAINAVQILSAPEPATLGLAAAGAAGLVWARRRRRRPGQG